MVGAGVAGVGTGVGGATGVVGLFTAGRGIEATGTASEAFVGVIWGLVGVSLISPTEPVISIVADPQDCSVVAVSTLAPANTKK